MGDRIDDPKKSRVAKLLVGSSLPNIWILSAVLSLVVLGLCFVVPFGDQNKREFWSTGPLTSHHAFLGSDCTACHQGSFQRISNSSCEGCHHAPPHPDLHPEKKDSSPSCVSCHREHSGERSLLSRNDALCTDCHASLSKKEPETKLRDVVSLEEHSEPDKLVDTAFVALNHKRHLADQLRGPDGEVKLQCSDCHHLGDDKKIFKPVSYQRDCARCHPLSFDDELPNVVAPHREPQEVFDFLLGQYAKQRESRSSLGVTQETLTAPLEMTRRLPAGAGKGLPDAALVSRLRQAESLLFTKTGCDLCHAVSERGSQLKKESAHADTLEVRFEMRKGNIARVGFNKARFDHAAHSHVSCQSCHDQTISSEQSSDNLIPGIRGCKTCHGDARDEKGRGGLGSPCVTCHGYHG